MPPYLRFSQPDIKKEALHLLSTATSSHLILNFVKVLRISIINFQKKSSYNFIKSLPSGKKSCFRLRKIWCFSFLNESLLFSQNIIKLLSKIRRKKERIPKIGNHSFHASDKIWTRGLLVRSQTLYPAELPTHFYCSWVNIHLFSQFVKQQFNPLQKRKSIYTFV